MPPQPSRKNAIMQFVNLSDEIKISPLSSSRMFDPVICCDHQWRNIGVTPNGENSYRCTREGCESWCARDDKGKIIAFDAGSVTGDIGTIPDLNGSDDHNLPSNCQNGNCKICPSEDYFP